MTDSNEHAAASPIHFTPESLANEFRQVGAKLGAAAETFAKMDEVHYGATEREEIWRDGKVVLYRFKGDKPSRSKVPLLISYALVNRPYMVDLQSDKSIVRGLLERGEDIYVIDWGYADRSDRYLELQDYIVRYLGGAVDALRERSGQNRINLLGICQGGVFSLCYTSLFPDKIRNLITMVTPVDFHTRDNMLSNWTRGVDADLLVNAVGNVSADMMNFTYLTLKPWRLFVQKYVGMVDILDNPRAMEDFLRMEKWIFDSPDQAGEAFREFTTEFFQGNGLVNGTATVGGQAIDLMQVQCPVYNIYAEQDHLVPPEASKALGGLIGSDDYSEMSFRGGHIGIYVSSRAQRDVPENIHQWLAAR